MYVSMKADDFKMYQEDETVDPLGIPLGEEDTPPDMSNLTQYLPAWLQDMLAQPPYAPGVKYNQWHDSSTGQFSSGDGSSVSIGTEMSTAVATHGGFTMTDHMHSGITSGKALSPYPDRSKVIQGVPTAKDVHSWLQKNHDILKLPNHYAGGWFDATTGKTFLDVSIVVKTAHEAHDLSIQYKQRAYYDLDTGSEVRTLSESEAHQA